MKLTKQGVRDLNPKGYNGRRRDSDVAECEHNFQDGVVIGSALHETGGWEYEVRGKKCLWCGEKRPS